MEMKRHSIQLSAAIASIHPFASKAEQSKSNQSSQPPHVRNGQRVCTPHTGSVPGMPSAHLKIVAILSRGLSRSMRGGTYPATCAWVGQAEPCMSARGAVEY